MSAKVSLWRIGTTAGKYRADDLSGGGAAAVGEPRGARGVVHFSARTARRGRAARTAVAPAPPWHTAHRGRAARDTR